MREKKHRSVEVMDSEFRKEPLKYFRMLKDDIKKLVVRDDETNEVSLVSTTGFLIEPEDFEIVRDLEEVIQDLLDRDERTFKDLELIKDLQEALKKFKG